jgi:hypothetical protein
MNGEKWIAVGAAMQHLGCAICLLVFVVIPMLVFAYACAAG